MAGVDDSESRERDRRADDPAEHAEREAFDSCEDEQTATRRPTRTQKRQIAAVTLDGTERSEIRETERDERARKRQHDVERLRVERIARSAREAVREVVHERDLTRQ